MAVEWFGTVFVVMLWLLSESGHELGSKFFYDYWLNVFIALAALLLGVAAFRIRRSPRRALFDAAVFAAWAVWAMLPRL